MFSQGLKKLYYILEYVSVCRVRVYNVGKEFVRRAKYKILTRIRQKNHYSTAYQDMSII
jgi:hypothetical protein